MELRAQMSDVFILDLRALQDYSQILMDENLKNFLEKFAELERRVRKLAAEDRALREEVSSLKKRLQGAESEAELLRESLQREAMTRSSVREKVSGLIERLDEARNGGSMTDVGKALAEVGEVEQ